VSTQALNPIILYHTVPYSAVPESHRSLVPPLVGA